MEKNVNAEQRLRNWLAKQLNRSAVPEIMWDMLKYRGHVEDALTLGEVAERELVDAAKMLRPYADTMEGVAPPRKEGRKSPPKAELLLSGYEKERAEALGEYLALRASLHPLVVRFRNEVLGGRPLTRPQANELAYSAAASRFPIAWFGQRNIPLSGHNATFNEHGVVLAEDGNETFVEYEEIFVDPPGEVFVAVLPVSVAYDDLERLRWLDEGRYFAKHEHFSSLRRDREYTHIPVYPGSVLDDLRQLSRRLVEELSRAWSEPQAAWFVLTDEVEAPHAITGHYDYAGGEMAYGTITLRVEPWVPAETVVKIYQQLQSDMLGHRPRAPSLRNVAVFRFVVEQLRASMNTGEGSNETPRRAPWRELMELWNSSDRARPECRYSNENQFSRDFRRGGRAVVDAYGGTGPFLPQKLSIP
jgi:hypothetical protein